MGIPTNRRKGKSDFRFWFKSIQDDNDNDKGDDDHDDDYDDNLSLYTSSVSFRILFHVSFPFMGWYVFFLFLLIYLLK